MSEICGSEFNLLELIGSGLDLNARLRYLKIELALCDYLCSAFKTCSDRYPLKQKGYKSGYIFSLRKEGFEVPQSQIIPGKCHVYYEKV